MLKKILIVSLAVLLVMSFAVYGCKTTEAKGEAAEEGYKLAMVVQSLGNPFFEACNKGGMEVAEEMGAEFIFQGPEQPTAEPQIEVVDAMIAQKVDAIIISVNDEKALVPVCQKALENGIKVVTFDAAVAPEGRDIFANQCTNESIGRIEVQIMGKLLNYEGEIAILSAASTMTCQNNWIEWMKKELEDPKYANMTLVTTVYGDDIKEKAYNEAMGLFKSYPNLKGIISPTTIGMTAASKALEDAGLNGKIELTGLGLPSEMKEYIKNGTCKEMALWNPVDLGYFSTYISYALLEEMITPKEGETFECGRLGEKEVTKDETGYLTIIMGDPFVFNADNIDEWAPVF